ncbi:hypothetical protein QQS21_008036 [Conoideocrella luteorostrata]|uniref:Uncharacterized protein n=1 Tax=Conoideocrella luteorostrata TaxID=1105319 RepID=A0AAJ0CKG3_9HYPO|nr:hypothetical protein QQS21_008036 [Conoideocrella luteorostrata]
MHAADFQHKGPHAAAVDSDGSYHRATTFLTTVVFITAMGSGMTDLPTIRIIDDIVEGLMAASFHDVEQLINNAGGLFIWAATACQLIYKDKKRQVVKDRLSSILQSSATVIGPEKHLNELYNTVLRHSIPSGYSDQEQDKFCAELRNVRGRIVVVLSPISTHSLSMLGSFSEENIIETLEDLHAILDIPEDRSQALRLHHPSCRDYFLNQEKFVDSRFWVREEAAHYRLVDDCIRIMSNSLNRDICGLKVPDTFVADMDRSQINQKLPADVKYACLYWTQYLQKSGARSSDNDGVHCASSSLA